MYKMKATHFEKNIPFRHAEAAFFGLKLRVSSDTGFPDAIPASHKTSNKKSI